MTDKTKESLKRGLAIFGWTFLGHILANWLFPADASDVALSAAQDAGYGMGYLDAIDGKSYAGRSKSLRREYSEEAMARKRAETHVKRTCTRCRCGATEGPYDWAQETGEDGLGCECAKMKTTVDPLDEVQVVGSEIEDTEEAADAGGGDGLRDDV